MADERFEWIERVTAGLAEERCKDREEFRALWRDTQRQLNDLTGKLADLGDRLAQIAEESRATDQRLAERIPQTDKHPAARTQTMIPAKAQFTPASKPPSPPA